MPFMKGSAPIRRTLQYLEAGRMVLKDRIQILSVNYNTSGDHHHGARDFVFWHLPQLQYKNPSVQVITFKNMTPSPFIRCFYKNGEEILIDIDSKTKDEIQGHLLTVLCKSPEILEAEAVAKEKKDNPAHFGYSCNRHCACEIPGQVPCPSVVPLPRHMREQKRANIDTKNGRNVILHRKQIQPNCPSQNEDFDINILVCKKDLQNLYE